MRAGLVVLLSHLIAAPAFSQEATELLPPEVAKRVALLEISSTKGVPALTLKKIIEAAGEGFIGLGYRVVPPAEVRALHFKGRLRPPVCNDAPGCLANAGRVVGAAYVARLSVARAGNGYWVKLMVVDTAEKKIVSKGLSLVPRGQTAIFARAIKKQMARATADLDRHIAEKQALPPAGSERARAGPAPAPIERSLEQPRAVAEAPATIAAAGQGTAPVAGKPAAAAPPSAAEALALQARARAQMRGIEYEFAIPLLLRALEAPSLTPHQKAEIYAELGLCQASLGEALIAGAFFDSALAAEPLCDLPAGTSPKIRQLFETIRARRAETNPLVASPSSLVALEANRSAERRSSSGPLVRGRGSPTAPRVRAVDYLLGSVALAGLGAGIGSGIVSSRAADDLMGGLHDRPYADRLKSRQHTWGVVSVVAYSVAGAAAAVALVKVVFLNGRSEAPSKITVGGSVSSSGAGASVQVSF